MGDLFISPHELWHTILAAPDRVRVFDVRRPVALAGDARFVPGCRWRDHMDTQTWARGIAPGTLIAVNCMHGHNVSQIAGAGLRAQGYNARVLAGGIDGWVNAGLPSLRQTGLAPIAADGPSKWVTGTAADAGRIACCWLVRRFIDPDAGFIFVQDDWLCDVAEELGATALDVGMDFNSLLEVMDVNDSVLDKLAGMVRGSDEAPGLPAVIHGMCAMAVDDHDALRRCLPVLDALHARLRHDAGDLDLTNRMQVSAA
jgi:rhodanese-related sulfurtransferase